MNWTQLHLALNHLPVVGTLFVLLLLVLGMIRGSEELKRLALQISLALFLLAMAAKYTGDWAHEDGHAEGEDAERVELHEQAGDQAVTGMFVLAAVSLAGLIRTRKRKLLPAWATIGALVLALATVLLMARAANLGGQIHHPELRSGYAPGAENLDAAP